MSYVRRSVRAGGVTYIKEYYTGRYHPKGETRQKRSRASSASVQTANYRNALDKLTWLLNENFGVGDLWVDTTYAKNSKKVPWEQMQTDFRIFLRRARRLYQKYGIELRYAAVPEVGERGSRHFHLVMPAMPGLTMKDVIEMLTKAWGRGTVGVEIVGPKKDKGTYDDIAVYMMKYSERTRRTLKDDSIKRYTRSQNLRAPKVEIKPILRGGLDKPHFYVPKGWRMVEDSLKQYDNEYGYAVRQYLCLRI